MIWSKNELYTFCQILANQRIKFKFRYHKHKPLTERFNQTAFYVKCMPIKECKMLDYKIFSEKRRDTVLEPTDRIMFFNDLPDAT